MSVRLGGQYVSTPDIEGACTTGNNRFAWYVNSLVPGQLAFDMYNAEVGRAKGLHAAYVGSAWIKPGYSYSGGCTGGRVDFWVDPGTQLLMHTGTRTVPCYNTRECNRAYRWTTSEWLGWAVFEVDAPVTRLVLSPRPYWLTALIEELARVMDDQGWEQATEEHA